MEEEKQKAHHDVWSTSRYAVGRAVVLDELEAWAAYAVDMAHKQGEFAPPGPMWWEGYAAGIAAVVSWCSMHHGPVSILQFQ